MKFTLALFLALISSAKAATIAIIDSGVDYRHQQLAHKMWLNPIIEYRGEFPRAINGWNFMNNSAQLFDYSSLKNYDDDVFKYLEILARFNVGSMTAEDQKFLQENLKDPQYMTKVSSYSGYAHGTHVAGIVTKNENHEIMGMTYLGSSVSSLLEQLNTMKTTFSDDDKKFHSFLAYVANAQLANFTKVTRFLENHIADVANGSFGAPFKKIQDISDAIFKDVYKQDPTDEESFKGAYYLQYYILKNYENLIPRSSKTLFVFAAGNDGLNNDVYPFTPSNVDVGNSISVAATFGTAAIAKFSNYGIKTVDVAAPGVNIYSAAPGANNLPMSGTSQAAPFVSRVAGKLKDINSKLSPLQMKQILMETVDKKAFLKKLVKSGGIVSEARAVKAAELSKTLSVARAIAEANRLIPQSAKSLKSTQPAQVELRHVEMPSLFID